MWVAAIIVALGAVAVTWWAILKLSADDDDDAEQPSRAKCGWPSKNRKY